MNQEQLDALCEYADGRREAGVRWDVIEEEMDGKVPQRVLDRLPSLHKAWARRRLYEQRQRVAGDRRQGESVAEVTVDWASADAAALKLDLAAVAGAAEVALDDRAVALAVVRYLHAGLLQAKTRWRQWKEVRVGAGERLVRCWGPGRAVTVAGVEVSWLTCAVMVQAGEMIRAVYPEARYQLLTDAMMRKHRLRGQYCRIFRRELDAEVLSPKEVSARLAAVLHTFLGGAGSKWRNNAELAKALGVSRQAVQVRKRKLLKKAGARAADGLRSTAGLGED